MADGLGVHADRIAEKLLEHDVDPSRLELEITESALMADPRRVLARGYALLADARGLPVSTVAEMARGDRLVANLADGQAALVVDSVAPAAPAA